MKYSEVEDSPTKSRAKKMETIIFTSHPVMQSALRTAVERSTLAATQEFEARFTKVSKEVNHLRQGKLQTLE
eukprot:7754869-Karenia_brevis.AAC.1